MYILFSLASILKIAPMEFDWKPSFMSKSILHALQKSRFWRIMGGGGCTHTYYTCPTNKVISSTPTRHIVTVSADTDYHKMYTGIPGCYAYQALGNNLNILGV